MTRAILLFALVFLCATPATNSALVITPHPIKKIAVLLFHQVTASPIMSAHGVDHIQEPWTTPAAFDALLSDLTRDGYTAIPIDRAVAYLQGKISADALPAHPLLITFDDGYESAWTQATPILRKHHAVATMFFEGHAVDNPRIPDRITAEQLRQMSASDVWSLESHGWAGHSNLPIGPDGELTPYWYANLAWLPDKHRLETREEFEARIVDDLTHIRTAFEKQVGHPLTLFAYPSGEFGQNRPLAAGENPLTLIEAGHSNASGLTSLLEDALRKTGYQAAFAVSLPVSAHFAGPSDDIYALPRIGVGAAFKSSLLSDVAAQQGVEYPEAADGQNADVGPICTSGVYRIAAATNRPVFFALDARGRRVNATTIASLAEGRASHNATIGGIACDGSTLYVVQQAGFDANPQPWLDEMSVASDGSITLVRRTAIDHVMNWLVGIALLDGHLYGITDRGNVYDVKSAQPVCRPAVVAGPADNRFAGLASRGELLYTIDRAENQLVAFTVAGSIVARSSVDPGMRDITFDGNQLLLTYWTTNQRSMRAFDIVELPH